MRVNIKVPQRAKRVRIMTSSESWPAGAPGQTMSQIYSDQEFEVKRGLFGRRLVLISEREIRGRQ